MSNLEELKKHIIELATLSPNNMELGQQVRELVWKWKNEEVENPNQTKINFK
jgi:hypothetical protein